MLIFLFFAARSPKFQTKIAKYYTQKLSKKLDAKVSIDSVNFELFHHLRVNGIYVEDLEGDTLLYAGSVKTSILKFAPFKKTYNLSNSTMDNVKIRLHRPADSLHFNLTDLLASESPKDSTQSSTKKPLRFKMKNIQLNNFDFQLLDELKKAEVKVVLPKMDVDFNTFDLSNKILDANTLVLHQADLANIKVKENNGEDKEPTVFGMPDDWTIKVDRFKIEDGQFKNNTKEKPADRRSDFLFNNFDLQDLQVDMQNIYGDGDTLHFRINQLSFLDKTGFEVSKLSAETSRFQPNGLSFENLELITPQSKLQGDLGFRFRSMDDFAEFNERIRLTAGITTGELHPVDLDYLFKKSPVNEPIEVTGNFRGRVSSLRASDLTLKFEHGSYLRGDIDSNGLPDVENTFFDADIERLYTDVAGIQKISGKYNLSDKITKLGTFDYSGKFTGFLTDLVSYGNLKTDLGNFETDINYSKKPGQRETYKGFLSTSNFELGEWLDNEDLGAINFSGSLNGSGFDLTTMNADVDADVTYLDYQGERYTNLNLDGTLQNSIFDGVFASANEKVDAQVSGRLDYSGQLAAFDIDAAIKKADLNALGVLDSPFEIVGDFSADVTGETIDEMIGNVVATNVNVVSNGEAYQFDSLAMILNKEDAGGRSLAINSEKVSAKFIGEYNYTELIPTIKKTINNYYDFNPEWDKIQNTITSEKPIGFEFIVEENDELTRLFLPDINFTSRTTADGTLNPTTNEINAEANAETLKIRQYTFHDWHLEGIGNGELLVINSSQSDILNKNSKWLDASDLTVELSKDNILANIKSFNKEFLDADISLQVTRNDDLFTASILDSDLVINNEEWEISENNSITIGKEYWEAKNFLIQNGEQKISIFNPVDDLDTKLIADIENIDLTDLNQFINFTAKPFGGTSTGSVNLVEINDRLNIDISLVVDDLMYNNDVASITSIDGLIDAETQAGQIEGIIQDDNFQIGFFGLLDLKSKDKVIDLDLELFKASLSPFENLWDNSISDVDGFVSGYMNFRGGPKVFNMQGDLFLEESLGVTLDFTKARYTAEAGQSIKLVENAFLIDQLILKDKDGNTARVNGAITHTDLKDFTLDVTAQSSNFLFLDTEASDNPVFYGTAYAGGTIAFTGPVQDAFMSVVATSQPN
ncbi:MAG: translocation/assembly module TamB domain-containing protein, partial [Saprospiraceae bacterium]|nr:translocation/assembly module TamB domain-containing protein [Saprospiraceae bacterium]